MSTPTTRSARTIGRRAAALLAATALTVLTAGTASAAPADLTLRCQADAPVLGAQNTTLAQSVDVAAPATVAPGSAFDVTISLGPTTVPASVNGFPVKEIKNLVLVLPVPKNSTYNSATLAGGDVEDPTVTVTGDKATVTLPGNFAGGSTVQLPTVTANLTAGRTGPIEYRLGGTGYDDPALTLTTTATVFGAPVDAPTGCYPDPDPVLATTEIG